MRDKFFVFTLIMAFAFGYAHAQVNFEQLGYRKALGKAKRQNRILFIYFYTDWCAPCKQLDTIAFSDSAIKVAINDNYISLKLNAEKGEGIELGKRYQVGSYPTFLFTDTTGAEIGRIVGTRSNSDYLVAIKSQGKNDPFREKLEELAKAKKK